MYTPSYLFGTYSKIASITPNVAGAYHHRPPSLVARTTLLQVEGRACFPTLLLAITIERHAIFKRLNCPHDSIRVGATTSPGVPRLAVRSAPHLAKAGRGYAVQISRVSNRLLHDALGIPLLRDHFICLASYGDFTHPIVNSWRSRILTGRRPGWGRGELVWLLGVY